MEASEDPFAELGMLIEALSEMAKPYGYVVETLSDPDMTPAPGIRKPGGFSFPDEKSEAAALASKYGSRPERDAYFFSGWETPRFPGGSPEELAPKAAAGIKAALYMR